MRAKCMLNMLSGDFQHLADVWLTQRNVLNCDSLLPMSRSIML